MNSFETDPAEIDDESPRLVNNAPVMSLQSTQDIAVGSPANTNTAETVGLHQRKVATSNSVQKTRATNPVENAEDKPSSTVSASALNPAPAAASAPATAPATASAAASAPASAPASGSAASSSSSHPNYSAFECNVCFDTPNDPVVTPCGHLYCWRCLYKWMQCTASSNPLNPSPALCPVCKACVEKSKVIPIYGRGSSTNKDPRDQPIDDVPPRPAGQRVESVGSGGLAGSTPFGFGPSISPFGRWNSQDGNYGSFSFTAFGLFPSVFGMHFNYPPVGGMNSGVFNMGINPLAPSGVANNIGSAGGRQQLTPEQQNQEFISRMMLMAALFIIFCLLFC
eukprot:CAMPEP_0184698656 /NCGR_PEP_ID=MMETSP0313-20130426/5196_1 /TAXON_ID=2792 /ORGANISM="Porphyridium aerugineum, Strain SAG 1380-2" /LENGTH=338 /DNA_ID=CAMNT_0027157623 /DNA_START=111 /DNA_END=1127 /DNA_ORIENTATION=+